MKLAVSAAVKFFGGITMVFGLIFLPAGTWDYAGGWLFLAMLAAPMVMIGLFLYIKAPELLKKRLNGREKRGAQKGAVGASILMFVGGFVLAGLDHRFGWSHVSGAWVIAACALWLVGYAMYAEVLRENAYLSRTIEVQKGQKLVDTGLYGIVRHPMYTATLMMFLSIPVMLGSWWALIVFAAYPGVIIMRLLNEEKLLETELTGYAGYMQRVKYRLVPFVW